MGSDGFMLDRLQTAYRGSGSDFCIANLTITTTESIEGSEDDEDDGEDYRGYTWSDKYGHDREEVVPKSETTAGFFTDAHDVTLYGQLAKDMTNGHILNENRINNDELDDTTGDSDTGLVTKTWERKVVIFMPRRPKARFFFEGQRSQRMVDLFDVPS